MASKLDIPLHGSSVNIVRRCGLALSDVLQSKFGCVAIIDGVDFESDPSLAQPKRPTVVPEERFAVALPAGVEVSVWKADLTDFKVEAVVNAANTHLEHHGGLALALSKAGGPQIQRECRELIQVYGALETGNAIVTDAGSLPCRKIIHAVGPQLSNSSSLFDVSSAEPLLRKAIQSILDRVKENHMQSVAIPAISSGLFHYPLPECANTIVTAVNCYCKNASGHLPKKILLVNNDEPSVKEMTRACRQFLTSHLPMKYSQAAASTGRGHAKASTTTVQIGNVHLTLKRGQIEEEQTNVIVNTASSDRDLSIGQISSALLKKAGQKMQQEIRKASLRGCIVATKSYKLHCKNVYHTFCTVKGKDAAQQVLYSSVSDCLNVAVTDNYQSISFPAIGTGALGFSKKEVAQIMSAAVTDFALKFPKKMEVYFVIYPSDNETFKAFEDQMRYLQQKASDPSLTHGNAGLAAMVSPPPAPENRDDFHGSRAPTPQISLSSPSDVRTREAEQWLHGLLFQSSGTVVIRNNFIQHFGEKEHLQLSRLSQNGVFIEESFEGGRAGITVRGHSNEDVVVAVLQVEAILCDVQREFVREEFAMLQLSTKNVSFERKTVPCSSLEFSNRFSLFTNPGLRMLKVDKVENPMLTMLFDLKKKQLRCSTPPQTMFQRIPAQFCEMVSHIGFHAEYAPPDDSAYGEGIYFAGSVKKAMEVWKQQNNEYLHFVEAEVLTGNSTPGKPGLILPPAVGMEYDSVSGGSGISVVFSGYQALPKYIITCRVV